MNDEWVTILFNHVWDQVEQLPPGEQQQAGDLIADGRWRIGNEIVDDESDQLRGLTYVVELLPEDGEPWRVAQVTAAALMAIPDPGLIEALDEPVPDDPSSLG